MKSGERSSYSNNAHSTRYSDNQGGEEAN